MVANKKKKISELFNFLPKSKIKAGEGMENGKYPFYTCSNELTKYYDEYTFEPNKLIFGTGGSASLHYASEPFATSTDCYVIEAKELNVDVKYVYYYLKNNFHILEDGFKGAGLKHISKDYLSNIIIEYPDIEEQQRIVNILDKAEEIRTKKKLANEKLDEFLKSTFIDMFGDPVNNPNNYPIQALEDVTKFITDGKHGDCEDEIGSGYYFVSAKCINNGRIDLTQARQIKYSDYQDVNKRVKINLNDLLMVNTGATIGKMAIVRNPNIANCITLQKSVAVINIDNTKLLTEYLCYCLKCKSIANVSAGSAIRNLLLSTMRSYKLPIPPIATQDKFSKIVQKVEAQKEKNQKVIEQMDNLFNSLMHQAFNSSL